jgi:glycoside/pentoside/hexuronide:cation symporter, GPH family
MAVSVYASLPFLIAVASLFIYEIDKRLEQRIESDLAARRASA